MSRILWCGKKVVRGRQEVDDRMKEFFKRVNNNDPREVSPFKDLGAGGNDVGDVAVGGGGDGDTYR